MTFKQTFELSTIQNAVDLGYDTCQFQYSGIPCRIEVKRGIVCSYAMFDDETIGEYGYIKDEAIDATLLGSVYHGPRYSTNPLYGKTVLIDCFALGSHGLHVVPYKERFALMRVMFQGMKYEPFVLVKNFPIKQAQELWDKEVESEKYKGLIFRKATDPLNCTILRRSYYKELPGDGSTV